MSFLDKFKKKTDYSEEKDIKTETIFAPNNYSGKSSNLFILKKPWITEKTTILNKLGKYAFIVASKTPSAEIKKAVESIYKVKVTAVNIINIKPKRRRLGRSIGKISGLRKAIVTLSKGQSIDIMPH